MTYLIIPCSPVAQPRQRHRVVAGHAQNYTPTNSPVNVFKATVRLTWQQFCGDVPPLDGPVYLAADFVLPLPKSRAKKSKGHRQWHDVKPDIDNLYKALADCLSGGLAFHDDRQVCMTRLTKTFSADCEQPKVELTVLPAEPIAREV